MATTKKNDLENDSLRKNIYFKNGRVRKAINEADNASDLVEVAVLYYLDSRENCFITRDEIEEIIKRYSKQIHTLDKKYAQALTVMNEVCEAILKK